MSLLTTWRPWRRLAVIATALALLLTGCAGGAEPPVSAPAVTSPAETAAQPTPVRTVAELAKAKPSWLEIPAIGVRTGSIIELGLEPDGSLEVPEDAVTAGWFEESPTPGELGPSVIAGHVDYDHTPGVFYRLHELPVGAKVIIHRADSTTAIFTVDKVERYPKSRFPTRKVYGNTDLPELRLITCGGAFDDSSGNYLDNVVAYARLTATRGAGK